MGGLPVNMYEVVAAFDTEPPQQEYVPTGSMVLDMAFRGYPVGRVTEITGDTMSGKTVLSYVAAAEMQKLRQGPVMWIDFRGEFSPRKAAQAGVDTSSLMVVHGLPTRYGVGMGPFRYLVSDSVTSEVDAVELLALAEHGRTVVANTWKYRMFPGQFPWIDLHYQSHNRTGATIHTELRGTQVVAPLEVCPQGIDRHMELLDLAEKAGMVTQKGSHWYIRHQGSPTTEYLGSGREKAARALSYEKVATAVRSVLQH